MDTRARRRTLTMSPCRHVDKCRTLRVSRTMELVVLAAVEALDDVPIDYTVDDKKNDNSDTEIYFLPVPETGSFN